MEVTDESPSARLGGHDSDVLGAANVRVVPSVSKLALRLAESGDVATATACRTLHRWRRPEGRSASEPTDR